MTDSTNIFKSVSDIRRVLVQDFFSSESNLDIIATYIENNTKDSTQVENGIIKVFLTAESKNTDDRIRDAIISFLTENKNEIMRSFIMMKEESGKVFADLIGHPEWVYDTINMGSSIIVRF